MMDFKDGSREKKIIKTAILGIIINVILASVKIFIALVSNSVAIISDAINNLSDAFSSLITIFGSKLAQKLPDENHPYGYGRVEYIGGLIVSIIVLMLGIEFLQTSIQNIINPVATSFTPPLLLILFIAIFVKFGIGFYYRKVGKETKSISLKAVGQEALGDAIIATIILISAALSYFANIQVDGYAGACASLFIIYNGVILIKETFDKIVGQRVEKQISDEIYAAIKSCDIVHGAYDLILHNYGVERYVGSANVEIDEHLPLCDVSQKLNELQISIYNKFRVYLVFGIYSINLGQNSAKECVANSLSDLKSIKEIHAFFINLKQKRIRFDVVVDYKERDLAWLRAQIEQRVEQNYPDFEVFIVIDREFS
ncbi:cation diffusion facilitator family transporter [Campylobacter suis]|uniref:Ferrous-iron efflux pump FieF n=1 Tax=Campylobacter suis TaxID=2790657 RepID=A0ABM8Q0W7_9BACT|nr:cation diffusion facilitator family transporter [Campylobacter suis]CAD7286465.1 Ferrous-iron efflux pump FieF [Campylobacter suis]